MTPSPLVLIVLDGWGYRETVNANAIASAKTPVWDALWKTYPHTTLACSGLAVGLPSDQMGNSEVGHLAMGAGRVVYQDFTRINQAIEDHSFNQNPIFLDTLEKVKSAGSALHVLGLLSPGGVHSHEDHIQALIKLAAQKNIQKIYMHAFLDGRDTPPQSAKHSLLALNKLCASLPQGVEARIASISGRYYAMDRDKRWERTEKVYELLTTGKTEFTATSAEEALLSAYERGETDEFVKPTVITPAAIIQDKDALIFMNFRSDRARQLSSAFQEKDFSGFTRKVSPKLSSFVTLTEYSKTLDATVAFPPQVLKNLLGEFCQQHHVRQLRIAETEKYAHVTFFFNGGRETQFAGEERILVPSKKAATYDLCPEMSAVELTTELVKAIHAQRFEVIICNYANADMVGHTGNFSATEKAIEVLDTCLGQVIQALQDVGGEALITADHGNAEYMFDEETQQPHTAHTKDRVPFLYVGRKAEITTANGSLSDIAPTLIMLMGQSAPLEMTGTSLVRLIPA